MLPTGRIFKNEYSMEYHKPVTVSSYMESDLSYDIYNMLTYVEECAFNVSVDYIKSKHYSRMYESYDILLEGANSLIESIKDFFSKLIKKIKEFWNKFLVNIRSYTTDFSKFLEKNKDRIRNLPDKTIKIQGYEYSLVDNVPNVSILDDIIMTFNKEIDTIDTLTIDKLNELNREFKSAETRDKLRGRILNSSTGYDETDFSNKIRSMFRNNKSDQYYIVVNKSYILEGMENYDKIKDNMKNAEKEQKQITNCLEKLKSAFNRKPIINRSNNNANTIEFNKISMVDNKVTTTSTFTKEYNYDKVELYSNFYKYKFEYTKFVSNCITRVYMEKVSAFKESLKQYERFLRVYIQNKDGTKVVNKNDK